MVSVRWNKVPKRPVATSTVHTPQTWGITPEKKLSDNHTDFKDLKASFPECVHTVTFHNVGGFGWSDAGLKNRELSEVKVEWRSGQSVRFLFILFYFVPVTT